MTVTANRLVARYPDRSETHRDLDTFHVLPAALAFPGVTGFDIDLFIRERGENPATEHITHRNVEPRHLDDVTDVYGGDTRRYAHNLYPIARHDAILGAALTATPLYLVYDLYGAHAESTSIVHIATLGHIPVAIRSLLDNNTPPQRIVIERITPHDGHLVVSREFYDNKNT